MAVVVGDTIRVVAKMRDESNSLIENRYFWRNTGSGPCADDDVLTGFEAGLSVSYGYPDAYMPDALAPESIEIDVVQFSGGKLITVRSVGAIAWDSWGGGGGTGEKLPEGNAAVINFPTVVPRTQGRKFLGPLVENANSDGLIGSGFLLSLINYAADFLAVWTVSTIEFTPGIMSKHALELVPFTSFVIPTVFGYQRRRKPGVGA